MRSCGGGGGNSDCGDGGSEGEGEGDGDGDGEGESEGESEGEGEGESVLDYVTLIGDAAQPMAPFKVMRATALPHRAAPRRAARPVPPTTRPAGWPSPAHLSDKPVGRVAYPSPPVGQTGRTAAIGRRRGVSMTAAE